MMKTRMRTIAITCVLVLLLSIGTVSSVYASIISPYYDAGCSNSSDGKHHMEGRSTCWARKSGTNVTRTGQGGQCKYCHMLIVTENNLFLNPYQGMGWYATRSAWATVGGNFTIVVTAFYSNSSYTDSIGRQFVWE